MKVSKMLGERFKDAPKDCAIESHALMMRGGYMKYVGNGIYSLFTPAKRITSKIERIIREEMDKIDGQEVMFPVVMPATLWEESGRYTSIGSEMARFKDRGGNPMVLGMTHEEAAVHLARDTAKSYADFPFMIYQVQTKFRDEPRARGGLIRVREFTMKDAYSFHTSMEDLENYYDVCYSDQFAIGFRISANTKSVFNGCFAYWYSGKTGRHYGFLAEGQFNSIIRDTQVNLGYPERDSTFLSVTTNGGNGVVTSIIPALLLDNPKFCLGKPDIRNRSVAKGGILQYVKHILVFLLGFMLGSVFLSGIKFHKLIHSHVAAGV